MHLKKLRVSKRRFGAVICAIIGLGGGVGVALYTTDALHKQRSEPQRLQVPRKTFNKPPEAPKVTIEKNADQDVAALTESFVADPLSLQMIVNKKHRFKDTFVPPDLVPVRVPKAVEQPLRAEAAKALEKLFAATNATGVHLKMNSAYRSFTIQTALYNQIVATQGESQARELSAKPGYSEHQSGLAADIGQGSPASASNAYAWIASHAHQYGFIVRYPKGKEAITGFEYEPWHIRYVGTTLATALHTKGLTMEEYFNIPGGDYVQ